MNEWLKQTNKQKPAGAMDQLPSWRKAQTANKSADPLVYCTKDSSKPLFSKPQLKSFPPDVFFFTVNFSNVLSNSLAGKIIYIWAWNFQSLFSLRREHRLGSKGSRNICSHLFFSLLCLHPDRGINASSKCL